MCDGVIQNYWRSDLINRLHRSGRNLQSCLIFHVHKNIKGLIFLHVLRLTIQAHGDHCASYLLFPAARIWLVVFLKCSSHVGRDVNIEDLAILERVLPL